jgi:hypothetical protein
VNIFGCHVFFRSLLGDSIKALFLTMKWLLWAVFGGFCVLSFAPAFFDVP